MFWVIDNVRYTMKATDATEGTTTTGRIGTEPRNMFLTMGAMGIYVSDNKSGYIRRVLTRKRGLLKYPLLLSIHLLYAHVYHVGHLWHIACLSVQPLYIVSIAISSTAKTTGLSSRSEHDEREY